MYASSNTHLLVHVAIMAAIPCVKRGCGKHYASAETCVQSKGTILLSVSRFRNVVDDVTDDVDDVDNANDIANANNGEDMNNVSGDDDDCDQTFYGYNGARCSGYDDTGFDDDDDDDGEIISRVFLNRTLFMQVVQLHYGVYRGGEVPDLAEPLKTALRFNVSDDKKGVVSQISLTRRDDTVLYAQLASVYKGLTYLTYSEGSRSKTIPLCHTDSVYQLCQELIDSRGYVKVMLHHPYKVNMRSGVSKYAMDKWKEWRPCKVKSHTASNKSKDKLTKQKQARKTTDPVVVSTTVRPECITVVPGDHLKQKQSRKSNDPRRYESKSVYDDDLVDGESDGDSDDSNITSCKPQTAMPQVERDVPSKPWKPKLLSDKTGLVLSNKTIHPYMKPKSMSNHQDGQMQVFAQLDKSIETYRRHNEDETAAQNIGDYKYKTFLENH